jgi:hypothetical protein
VGTMHCNPLARHIPPIQNGDVCSFMRPSATEEFVNVFPYAASKRWSGQGCRPGKMCAGSSTFSDTVENYTIVKEASKCV